MPRSSLIENRTAKAFRIADVLRAKGCTADDARELTAAGWAQAAAVAGKNKPSPETQQAVTGILRSTAPLVDDGTDPFTGL